jgi:hypothetical protein
VRRGWRWPLLEAIRSFTGEDWAVAWLVWLLVGFVVVLMPALIVDSHGGHTYFGSYLLAAVVVYCTPLVVGGLAAMTWFAIYLLHEYGYKVLPRRVVEPVRQDLRSVYRTTRDGH